MFSFLCPVFTHFTYTTIQMKRWSSVPPVPPYASSLQSSNPCVPNCWNDSPRSRNPAVSLPCQNTSSSTSRFLSAKTHNGHHPSATHIYFPHIKSVYDLRMQNWAAVNKVFVIKKQTKKTFVPPNWLPSLRTTQSAQPFWVSEWKHNSCFS